MAAVVRREHTKPPMTKGMQNQVRFLISRQICAKVRTAMQIAAIAPPTKEGVYGQSTYSGAASDIMMWRICCCENCTWEWLKLLKSKSQSCKRKQFVERCVIVM